MMANKLRVQLQSETCCPYHAFQTLLLVMGGFAMDDAGDNGHEAAANVIKASKQLAKRIRTGGVTLTRVRHQ
jgi:hypothetical protein